MGMLRLDGFDACFAYVFVYVYVWDLDCSTTTDDTTKMILRVERGARIGSAESCEIREWKQ